MLLKEAYQRRIAEQITNHSPTYLKIKSKSPAIGSVQLERVNFKNDQTFFTQNDIPKKVKQLKLETQSFTDPDILQLKKKKWNISVQSPKFFNSTQDQHSQRLFKIKHGFYDFTPQISQKPYQSYAGTDTRNDYTGWNVSVDLTKKQKNERYHNLMTNSLDNTVCFNQSKLHHYRNPINRFQDTRNFQKERSLKQSDLQKTLKEKYQSENVYASPEKTNAAVARLLQQTRRSKLKEILFVNKDELEMTKKFKASLSDSQKVKITEIYVHNGIWSKVSSNENSFAWSCCMNEDQNGRGCVKKIVDGNRLNFSSFNNY